MNKLLIFAAGLAIGSAATYKFVKNKYEKIANEEIESVKEVFYKREKKSEDEPEEDEDYEPTKDDISSYNKVINENGYNDYSTRKDYKKEEKENMDKPYVITPEEFGEMDEYNTVSLTYYDDGVLTDEMDNVITDVEDTVGEDSLTHFGEYEDDSVFVRNDARKTDYEILADADNYADKYC